MSMTKKMNDLLYAKMNREYESFIEKVKTLPPEQILERAYEKITKQDILLCLESDDIEYEKAKALLSFKNPLEELYQQWLRVDDTYMNELRSAIDDRATEAVIQVKKAAKGMER